MATKMHNLCALLCVAMLFLVLSREVHGGRFYHSYGYTTSHTLRRRNSPSIHDPRETGLGRRMSSSDYDTEHEETLRVFHRYFAEFKAAEKERTERCRLAAQKVCTPCNDPLLYPWPISQEEFSKLTLGDQHRFLKKMDRDLLVRQQRLRDRAGQDCEPYITKSGIGLDGYHPELNTTRPKI